VSDDLPVRYKSDERWCELAVSMAVDELIVGKLLAVDQADFARRIVAQELFILLVSNQRPGEDPNSN
jgi:hypothetical protein